MPDHGGEWKLGVEAQGRFLTLSALFLSLVLCMNKARRICFMIIEIPVVSKLPVIARGSQVVWFSNLGSGVRETQFGDTTFHHISSHWFYSVIWAVRI